MKKNVVLLVLLTIFSSFSVAERLESDLLLKQVYNENEIGELKKILNFFDNEICKIFNKTEIAECYKKFLKQQYINDSLGTYYIMIPFEKQETFFKTLDASFILENWESSISFVRKENKYYESLNLKATGKFAKYLELLSSNIKEFKIYSEALNEAGCISPSMIGYLTLNYKQFDINDERIRLVFAIHYMTMNDETNSHREVDGFK